MLQQILDTMYVDPELLGLMTPEQKELLFRRMRDEQLRRWNAREKELKTTPPRKKKPQRRLQFLLGADGEPWTWVMGEHGGDLTHDELVRQRERREREKEEEEEREMRRQAEEFAKQETGHILSLASRFGELQSPSGSPSYKRLSLDVGKPANRLPVRRLVSDSAVGSSTASSRHRGSLPGGLLSVPESLSTSTLLSSTSTSSTSSSSLPRTESQLDLSSSSEHIDSGEPRPTSSSRDQEDLRRVTFKKQVPIIGRTKEAQQRFQEQRAEEIVSTMKRVKELARKKSMEVTHSVEEAWRESEQRAKAFERTRKASFNQARRISQKSKIDERQILEGIPEERKKELEQKMKWDRAKQTRRPIHPGRINPSKPLVRRSSILEPGTRPKTLDHVVTWFREKEAPRGHCRERDGTTSLWFHGRLGRAKAEYLLDKKPVGSYLVRLSLKTWGYTISVKTYADVKHFLVDVSSGWYQFLGPKQRQFRSLNDLLAFYRGNPITSVGQEVLLIPVAQLEPEDSQLFRGLFRDDDDDEGAWSTFL